MSTENPPAFPEQPLEHDHYWYPGKSGMSLRDYFAAKALQGLICTPVEFTVDAETSKPIESWPEYAQAAYKIADAMLAARTEDRKP